MRIVYLPSCTKDFAWFRQYYTAVFPAGELNAKKQFLAIEQALRTNPFIGHPSDSHEDVRELHIPKTPFTVIYRVSEAQIEVLRLWDDRQGGSF